MTQPDMRTCRNCEITKPATVEYFYARDARGHLRTECIECYRKRERYRQRQRLKRVVEIPVDRVLWGDVYQLSKHVGEPVETLCERALRRLVIEHTPNDAALHPLRDPVAL